MYSIFLDNVKIGTTMFENRDSSMGVVFGKINLIKEEFNYDYIKKYCLENNVQLTFDDPSEKLIATRNIPKLKIFNKLNIEITNKSGCNIEGMDKEGFQVTILGIPYSFFEKEFYIK